MEDKREDIIQFENSMLLYEKGMPGKDASLITRVEVSVNTTLPLTRLHELRNKFLNIHVLVPDFSHHMIDRLMPEGEHNLRLFLDSVRFGGPKHALRKIPDHIRPKYNAVLKHATIDLMEGYHDVEDWREHWRDGLSMSGLLSDV